MATASLMFAFSCLTNSRMVDLGRARKAVLKIMYNVLYLTNWLNLRWLFTTRVLQFMRLRHNIMSNCFYVYHHSSVVQGMGLVNRTSWVQIRRRLLINVTEICFWKSYLPKNNFSLAFCTFISVICYFIFHHQTISSWFKKLYPGVMSHVIMHRSLNGRS